MATSTITWEVLFLSTKPADSQARHYELLLTTTSLAQGPTWSNPALTTLMYQETESKEHEAHNQ